MGNPILNARGDELLYGGEIDPRVTPVDAPKGAMYIYAPEDGVTDPEILQKNDDGLTTNWGIYTTGMATDFSNAVASVVDIDLGTNKIVNMADPTNAQDAATKNYVDSELGSYLPLAGGTMSGAVDMGSNLISNAANPTNPQDLATKNYVDTQDALLLPLAGGTMSGAIDMGSSLISNLASPVSDNDAARKIDVDSVAAGVVTKQACQYVTNANIASILSANQATVEAAIDQTGGPFVLASGDRILVKDQSSNVENGVYEWNGSNLSRSSDFDGTPGNEVKGGDTSFVIFGDTDGGISYRIVGSGAINVGVDPIVWTPASVVGSFADQMLSNLVAPVNLNQNLTTSKASRLDLSHQALGQGIRIDTAVNPGGSSGAIELLTGNSTGGPAGNISLTTGLQGDAPEYADIFLAAGEIQSDAQDPNQGTQARTVLSGDIFNLGGVEGMELHALAFGTFNLMTANEDNLVIQAGANNNSGEAYLRLRTNSNTSGVANTGFIDIVSGNAGSNRTSGNVSLGSGAGTGTNGSSGNVLIRAGNARDGGTPGQVQISTFDAVAGNTNSGTINLRTGNSIGTGNSGNIELIIGTSSGTQGNIRLLKSGLLPTPGDVWTCTAADGSGYWAPAASGGANTALSNLTSPTSINQDLLPSSALGRSLGSSALPFDRARVRTIHIQSGAGTERGLITPVGSSSPSGTPLDFGISNVFGGSSIGYYTLNNPTNDANPTGSLFIETGNKTNGTGDSGSITLSTGTSAGGSRGVVNIQSNNAIFTRDTSAAAFWWGGNVPALFFDGANSTDIQNASTHGIIWGGDANTNYGLIATQDNATAIATPGIDIITGYQSGIGPSGGIDIQTGESSGAGGNSGGVTLRSGNVVHPAGAAQSGVIVVESGNTSSGNASGTVNVRSGSCQNAPSGALNLSTGSSVSSNTGNVNINTGNAALAGSTGNIVLTTGSSSSGTRGYIDLNAPFVGLPTGTFDPTTSVDGACYYNTSTDQIRVYRGGTWRGVTLT